MWAPEFLGWECLLVGVKCDCVGARFRWTTAGKSKARKSLERPAGRTASSVKPEVTYEQGRGTGRSLSFCHRLRLEDDGSDRLPGPNPAADEVASGLAGTRR